MYYGSQGQKGFYDDGSDDYDDCVNSTVNIQMVFFFTGPILLTANNI